MPKSSTRAALLASWNACRRQADRSGAILLNAASFAGYALDHAGGNTVRARALVPCSDESPFWARVRSCLDAVDQEESGVEARA